MGKSMIDLQNAGDEVTSLSNDDLFLTNVNPATSPDDKVISWTNIKALLKTYNDTLYTSIGTGYLSWGTYVDLNPMTATGKYPYGATIDASMSFIRFSVACFTAGTAHDNSNYYTIELFVRQTSGDTSIANVNTKTLGSSIAGLKVLSTTSFSPSSVTGTGYAYTKLTKTGTPSDFYILVPALKIHYT